MLASRARRRASPYSRMTDRAVAGLATVIHSVSPEDGAALRERLTSIETEVNLGLADDRC
jgi:hypothetical protein